MEILLWLLPAAVVTGFAMLWAGWAGRDRSERERTEADDQRFAEAILKPMPQPSAASARSRQRAPRTGAAVRRPTDPSRRSA